MENDWIKLKTENVVGINMQFPNYHPPTHKLS